MWSIVQVRRYHRALWGALLALLIAGLLSIQLATAVSADVSVNIMNFSFQPTPLTIPVGTTVVWTNRDAAPHTVTSDVAGIFDTGTLMPGQTGKVTFNTVGTFAYHCNIHPTMHGMVVVTAAAASTPAAPPASTTSAPAAPAPSAAPPAPAPVVAPPPAPPRTGGGEEAHYIRRLGDG